MDKKAHAIFSGNAAFGKEESRPSQHNGRKDFELGPTLSFGIEA